MELFRPNDLSLDAPPFAPLEDSAARNAIAAVLRKHYPAMTSHPVGFGERSSAHGSSRNFLVESPAGRFVLKHRTGPGERERLGREVRIGSALAERGVPVPEPVPAGSGEYVVAGGDAVWVLYRFASGTHFSGRARELDSAARAFAHLVRAAATLDDDLAPPPSGGAGAFLDTIGPLVQRLPERDDAAWEGLPGALASAAAARERLESHSAVAHLDFHPANLLLANGRITCILDTEDIAHYPLLPAAGFAAYKLIREAVARGNARVTDGTVLLDRWSAPLRQCFPVLPLTGADLAAGARYRVLALIHLILDRRLNRGDSSFTYDLPKQLASLAEIDELGGTRGS